jgi:putative hydrolase of the HAD superfamily
VISAEVGYRKPHPAFYRAACESLGLPAERVLCVGDDPENDVLGPRRAGLRGVLLDRGLRSAQDDLPRAADLAALIDGRV